MGRARSFYICQNNSIQTPHEKSKMKNTVFRSGASSSKKPTNKMDVILEAHIKSLLDKYKDDPEITAEIRGCLSMYECNRTIAVELGHQKLVAELTKEFINRLNRIKNRKD